MSKKSYCTKKGSQYSVNDTAAVGTEQIQEDPHLANKSQNNKQQADTARNGWCDDEINDVIMLQITWKPGLQKTDL